jgi:exopolyphosphatase/guanosine-5'-triphosphate,3'-diphosphate pyrophosphatase
MEAILRFLSYDDFVGPSPEGKDARAERVAVVDLGTNSTRLLVADVLDGRITEIARRSEVTRLGRGVDLSGRLSSEGMEAVFETVEDYATAWQSLEVDEVTAVATSAVRDASNSDAFLAELRERFAISPRLISGDEEAKLTYLGATAGRPRGGKGGAGTTLVCDIGGGSTELILGRGPDVSFFTSLRAGVVRQTERHIKQDPPTPSELEELAEDVRGLIADAIGNQVLADAASGIAVAGTATSVAAIDLELDPYDPERVHSHRLPMSTVQRICSRAAGMTVEERRRELTGLHPGRAPTIVAGIVILIQVMRAFGLEEIEISERDILHGAALEAAANP